jgi:hypothetical protein
LTDNKSSSDVGVVAEAAETTLPRSELSKLAIIFDKLEVKLFFFLTDNWSFGVLRCMAGAGIRGVVVPEAVDIGAFPGKFPGILGTELAVGKLRLGDTGSELTRDGVVVRFWGVPTSPRNW